MSQESETDVLSAAADEGSLDASAAVSPTPIYEVDDDLVFDSAVATMQVSISACC